MNGQEVGNHSGGHLPFEFSVTDVLRFTEANIVTVAVNNTLTMQTIPQGKFIWHDESKKYPAGEPHGPGHDIIEKFGFL